MWTIAQCSTIGRRTDHGLLLVRCAPALAPTSEMRAMRAARARMEIDRLLTKRAGFQQRKYSRQFPVLKCRENRNKS